MASVTIVGSGFTGATQCFFGSTAVAITKMNAAGTSFICTPPAGSGTVTIGITGSGGTVTGTGPKGYTYMGMPTISSINVTMGLLEGWTPVKILGTNYYDRSVDTFPGNTCGVSFGNTYGQWGFLFGQTNKIYTYSPPGATYGSVRVSVNTPTGNSNGLTFTYINLCSCPSPLDNPVCDSGVTWSCLNDLGGHSRLGCNCCACCEAMCALNPLCCGEAPGLSWVTETCGETVIYQINDIQSTDVKTHCRHLAFGACCVKFNIEGASYSICLSSDGTSLECGNFVDQLNTQNDNVFPWKYPYTVKHNLGLTCASCNTHCAPLQCISNPGTGITCSYCPDLCCLYGYCGSGCTCTHDAARAS